MDFASLNDLKLRGRLKKKNDARTAFHELKKILTTDLILGLPDDTLQFKIQSDASVDGIGAVLLQITLNGDRSLAYMSKKLTKTQTNWSTICAKWFCSTSLLLRKLIKINIQL
ncbi:unnamed protein product [Rotaria magnacalcarata]